MPCEPPCSMRRGGRKKALDTVELAKGGLEDKEVPVLAVLIETVCRSAAILPAPEHAGYILMQGRG